MPTNPVHPVSNNAVSEIARKKQTRLDECGRYLASAKRCLGDMMTPNLDKTAIRSGHLTWSRESIGTGLEIQRCADLTGGSVADLVAAALQAVEEALDRVCQAWTQPISDHIAKRGINAFGAYANAQEAIKHAECVFKEIKVAEKRMRPPELTSLSPLNKRLQSLIKRTPTTAKDLAMALRKDVKAVYRAVRQLRYAGFKIKGSRQMGYWSENG